MKKEFTVYIFCCELFFQREVLEKQKIWSCKNSWNCETIFWGDLRHKYSEFPFRISLALQTKLWGNELLKNTLHEWGRCYCKNETPYKTNKGGSFLLQENRKPFLSFHSHETQAVDRGFSSSSRQNLQNFDTGMSTFLIKKGFFLRKYQQQNRFGLTYYKVKRWIFCRLRKVRFFSKNAVWEFCLQQVLLRTWEC